MNHKFWRFDDFEVVWSVKYSFEMGIVDPVRPAIFAANFRNQAISFQDFEFAKPRHAMGIA